MESMESVKDGLWISYSQKDYKRIEEGNYKNGEKDGVWYAYFPGGKIPCVTTTYKNGKLDGKMTELDRRGNVISDCDYKDGLKHGKMRVYDKKGKVVKELEFEFGQQLIRNENKSIQFNPN
jgi:antitoxin component YwqK of YwqJK toxin-antitoxin module